MPDWSENEISVKADSEEELQQFLVAVLGPEGSLDFNKIVPMPEELDIEDGSSGSRGWDILYGDPGYMLNWETVKAEGITTVEELREWYKTKHPESIELARRYKENLDRHGAKTWYDWRVEHWGTKWNAVDTEIDVLGNEAVIRFNTAWCFPEPILRRLQEMFPHLEIHGGYIETNFVDVG